MNITSYLIKDPYKRSNHCWTVIYKFNWLYSPHRRNISNRKKAFLRTIEGTPWTIIRKEILSPFFFWKEKWEAVYILKGNIATCKTTNNIKIKMLFFQMYWITFPQVFFSGEILAPAVSAVPICRVFFPAWSYQNQGVKNKR